MLAIIKFVKGLISNKRNLLILAVPILTIVLVYVGWKIYIHHKPPVIDETRVVLQEVRKIAQLFTCRYYDECVSELKEKGKKDPFYVLIAKGTVVAGYDLSTLSEKDSFIISGNTLTIKINPPQIMEVIVLPSGFEPFIWERTIKQRERIEAQKQAAEIIKKNALDKGILKLSEEQGKKILINFFESLGFDEVLVELN